MQIHRSLSAIPALGRTVLTIGTFDGVHLGHRQILAQLVGEAGISGLPSVLITFHPHPRSVVELQNPVPLKLLTTLDEKIALLHAAGIDHLVLVPFNEAFASMTAGDYIEHFLWNHFKPATVIIGYDHKFGQGRKGDFHLLGDYGKKLGFAVKEIPEWALNESAVSSTRIRNSIAQGKMAEANRLLGHRYSFRGEVVMGNQLGRTIDFPTANLQVAEEKLLPANGVYAVLAAVGEHTDQWGMMNIGMRPTVQGRMLTTEVHLLHFSGDLYGKMMTVQPISFLRGEQKFEGLDALKTQLFADAEHAERVLGAM